MAAPLKWFPFEIDAWETDESVRQLSWAGRGVYLALLCWQWREGSVPADPKVLSKALAASRPLVARVLQLKFIADGTDDQRLVNRKLAQVYADQCARSEKAAAAGKASAEARLANPLNRSRRSIREEIKRSLSGDHKPNGNGTA